MSAIETLESVASLLPQERKERFLLLVARLRSVPEDDEYLQVLEAIGFMTLLWNEVPAAVKSTIEGASPVGDTASSLAATVREAVHGALPSYDDLKRMAARLEAHELALKNTLKGDHPTTGGTKPAKPAMLTFAAGVVAGLTGYHLLVPLLR